MLIAYDSQPVVCATLNSMYTPQTMRFLSKTELECDYIVIKNNPKLIASSTKSVGTIVMYYPHGRCV